MDEMKAWTTPDHLEGAHQCAVKIRHFIKSDDELNLRQQEKILDYLNFIILEIEKQKEEYLDMLRQKSKEGR